MLIDFGKYYQPTEKQLRFHRSRIPWKFIGGAMGGGKSYGGCAEVIAHALRYPGSRIAIIRKTFVVLRRTTLVTFLRVCPPEAIANFNRGEMIITLVGGSQILFLDCDISKDKELNKLRSLEVSAIFVDEAPEIADKAFRMMVTRVGRWPLPDGSYPPRWILCSGNPEPGWCQERFVDQQLENHAFFPIKLADNPHQSENYLGDLKSVLTPDEVRKYVYGEWVSIDDPNQLISYVWLRDCVRADGEIFLGEGEQSIGVDVARYGDDDSAISRHFSDGVAEIQGYRHQSNVALALKVEAVINEHNVPHKRTIIDSVGVGSGVYDILREEHGYKVREFIAGAKANKRLKRYTFANLKAQSLWILREKIRVGDYEIPNHTRLKEDLISYRYFIRGDRVITIEDKETMKKRLGRSPDYGDAVMMGSAADHIGTRSVTKSTLV